MTDEIMSDGCWALTSCEGYGHEYYIRHVCKGVTERYGKAWCEYGTSNSAALSVMSLSLMDSKGSSSC
jgi:hypothetical protein